MRRLNFLLSFLLLIPYTFFSSQCVAQGAVDHHWQILFNGKNLNGWHRLNGKHIFEAKNGMIVGTSVPGEPNGFLVTNNKYGDFILELEVKIDLLMNNSGIQFRSLSNKSYRNYRVHGYQAEIDTKPQRWSGGIYDEARRGWLYILENENSPAKNAFKNNKWNKYRIEAIGNTIRVWVNDIPTSHLIDDETKKGFIGLQMHANSPGDPSGSHQIRFRNIRIKTDNLKPRKYDNIRVVNLIPNSISGQEKRQGFSLLWDGKTTKGWRGVHSTSLPEKGWKIDKDKGVLTIISPNSKGPDKRGHSVMMTKEKYGAFEMKFEFKPQKKHAIAGIKYVVEPNSEKKAIYGRLAAKKTRGVGQWNRGRIKVFRDNKVEYWLNGYKILEYYLNSQNLSKGNLVLGDYGDPVSYRSIKIRNLN